MAVGIDEAVAAVAGAAHLAGRLVENVVVQRHAHAVVLGDRGLNADRFTEFGHGLILAGDLEDGAAVACGLDAVVAEAELLEQIDAGLLEPADVVRVMDDTHAVGLVVLDLVFTGVHENTSILRMIGFTRLLTGKRKRGRPLSRAPDR